MWGGNLRMHQLMKIDKEVLNALSVLAEKKIIEYDAEKNEIVINMDVNLKVRGKFQVDCEEHMVLNSGKGIDPELKEQFSIWLNPVVDSKGEIVISDEEYIEQSELEWPLIR